MSFGDLLDGLIRLIAAAAGCGASLIILTNLPGALADTPRVKGMSGLKLIIGAALFWGVGYLGFRWFGDEAAGLPLFVEILLTLAGGIAAWLFFRFTAGGFPVSFGAPGWSWTVMAYLGAVPGFLGLSWFNTWLVSLFREIPEVSDQAVLAGIQTLGGWELAGALLIGILAQPVVEEALFRGYLWRYLAGRKDFGPERALAFSTIAFVIAHDPSVYLPIAWLGLFFGWVCWRTGSVGQTMFAHVLHNGTAVLIGILLSLLGFS